MTVYFLRLNKDTRLAQKSSLLSDFPAKRAETTLDFHIFSQNQNAERGRLLF